MESIRKYGNPPYQVVLLHGGPGVAGDLKPVAAELGKFFGVLEALQTKDSVEGLLDELHDQITAGADLPAILVGHSWGTWLAFLFAGRYPELTARLILISAGAFELQYNPNLMKIRLERLKKKDRKEAGKLTMDINFGNPGIKELKRFGELMNLADAYDLLPGEEEEVIMDLDIMRSVWKEAAELRDSNQLIEQASKIHCPVVAIHGEYDVHPAAGVEYPLGERIQNFRMIRLEKCGHNPWRERQAREVFFEILKREIKKAGDKEVDKFDF